MVVTITQRTLELVDELLTPWQEATKTENTQALIARSVVDALLDLRGFATEFDQMDATAATAA